MSDLVKRVATRWLRRAQGDEPHDPTDGVFYDWQYESLTDPWKGYTFYVVTWTWDAANYEEQDEPDDWGHKVWHSPIMTLDEVVKAILRTAFKWDEWIDDDTFQSVVKKTRKVVIQGITEVKRLDDRPLSYEERKFITRHLKLKKG